MINSSHSGVKPADADDSPTTPPPIRLEPHYPFPHLPQSGATLEVAPGIRWVRMPLPDIANLTFRNLWRLPYDLNESIWILMELSGYKALVDDIASGQFLKYVPPTQADVDGTTHDDPNTDPVIPDLAKEA